MDFSLLYAVYEQSYTVSSEIVDHPLHIQLFLWLLPQLSLFYTNHLSSRKHFAFNVKQLYSNAVTGTVVALTGWNS